MATGSHFGCPKITVSHFLPFQINTTIFILVIFFTKWLPAAILDVRKSLSIAFLAISDQYATLIFVCELFLQNGCSGNFGCPKITFGHISDHFRSIRNFFKILFTKWLPSAILDVWNSLWITFLAILDQYRFFIFFYKMAARGHFGCSKITFDLISGHFRPIRNFILFGNFWQNGCCRPFWMSENHFRSHFYPFHIDTQLNFF